MNMNDERIPAHVRAAHAKKQPREKIDNTQALKESGLTIVHANMVDYFGGDRLPRAVTIAYERINKSHFRISTAVCHKSDVFEKKRGTKIALANFAKGNTVIIPASSTENAANQLRRMFGFIA